MPVYDWDAERLSCAGKVTYNVAFHTRSYEISAKTGVGVKCNPITKSFAEVLDKMLNEHNGILLTKEVIQAGISKTYETALYLLGLAGREPLQFTVTVKAGYHAKSMDEQNVKVYRIREELWETGVAEAESPAGYRLRVYNSERAICDLLRSRSNIEIQDLRSALNVYIRSGEKNLPLEIETAKDIIEEIIMIPIDDGIIFTIKNVSVIMDEAEYSGIRINLEAQLETMRTPITFLYIW